MTTARDFQRRYATAGLIVLLIGLYYLTAKLGLALSVVGQSVTLIWPPTGLSLAALLIFGYRLWPGIALGAFIINSLTSVPLLTALGMSMGNTLEALIGAWLLNQYAGAAFSLDRIRHVVALIVLAGAGSTMVSATLGVFSLCSGGVVSWSDFMHVWRVWWMGDAMGDLVFAPALLVWARPDEFKWSVLRSAEAILLLVVQIMAGILVFGGLIEPLFGLHPSAFPTSPTIFTISLKISPVISPSLWRSSSWKSRALRIYPRSLF